MVPAHPVETARAHQPFDFSNIPQWSMQEWGAIFAVAGFFYLLAALGAPSGIEKQQLRGLFHLPSDVALTKVYTDRSSAKPFPAAIEGYVQFTEPQFGQYVAQLNDKSVWLPVPVTHGGTRFHGSYAPDTLVWRELRDARQLAWGDLSWKQAQEARNGRLLCYSVRDDGSGAEAPGFRGEPCPPPNTPTVKAAYVQGLLDFDTKTLHMLIRQTRHSTSR